MLKISVSHNFTTVNRKTLNDDTLSSMCLHDIINFYETLAKQKIAWWPYLHLVYDSIEKKPVSGSKILFSIKLFIIILSLQ